MSNTTDLEDFRTKFPELLQSEEQMQAKCVEWFHNTYHEHRGMLHCNNNNSHNKIAGNKARTLGVYPGVSDLELILNYGKVAFIELKIAGGVVSKQQKEWSESIVKRGHFYFIVYSFEGFQTLIKKLI